MFPPLQMQTNESLHGGKKTTTKTSPTRCLECFCSSLLLLYCASLLARFLVVVAVCLCSLLSVNFILPCHLFFCLLLFLLSFFLLLFFCLFLFLFLFFFCLFCCCLFSYSSLTPFLCLLLFFLIFILPCHLFFPTFFPSFILPSHLFFCLLLFFMLFIISCHFFCLLLFFPFFLLAPSPTPFLICFLRC